MTIGVPKEIKTGENRVALTPAGARVLTREGHVVLVEANAGTGSGLDDTQYDASGAKVVASAEEIWGGRSGAEGKGAAAERVCFSPGRTFAVHASPFSLGFLL